MVVAIPISFVFFTRAHVSGLQLGESQRFRVPLQQVSADSAVVPNFFDGFCWLNVLWRASASLW
jgi:hypothetical protein